MKFEWVSVRARDVVAAISLLSFVTMGGCGDEVGEAERATAGTVEPAMQPSAEARSVVDSVHRRFGRLGDGIPSNSSDPAMQILRDGAWLKPRVARQTYRAVVHGATVDLPVEANGAFRVLDLDSGVSIEVTPIRIRPVPAEITGDVIVYRNALEAGSHLLQRVTAVGTEDFVLFEQRPDREELSYDVTLGDEVAGLRLVARTLEVLDRQGVSRLRMAPPYALDEAGQYHEAAVRVQGCAVDTSPRVPTSATMVDRDASTCRIVVSFSSTKYPLLVDPAWTTTGSMTVPRRNHTASLLNDGRVLVTGGVSSVALSSAEIYTPATGTWAVTSSMSTIRREHTASVLPSGKVLAAGGVSLLASAEIYDPASGLWGATGAMVTGRSGQTASLLLDGRVLVAGGSGPSGSTPSTEIYDPSTGMWTSAGSLAVSRMQHTANVLLNGKVLVAGGYGGVGSYLNSAEIYDPSTNSWANTGILAANRTSHASSLLPDGRVLVSGGFSLGIGYVQSTEIYDPATGGWSIGPNLLTLRRQHVMTTIAGGGLLVVGGNNNTGALATAEYFDPISQTWQALSDMNTARDSQHTITTLMDGSALVVGGSNGGSLAGAEIFRKAPEGSACVAPGDCMSGYCVDGVCCGNECSASCSACSTAKKGQGIDGDCGPIKSGADPDNECAPLGAGACQTPGTCDGSGTCATHAGDLCSQTMCGGPTTQINASTCDAVGNCISNGNSSCVPYICQGSACMVGCTVDAECAPGYVCAAAKCKQPGPNGVPCSAGKECSSQFCADGICCNSPCNGACESCLAQEKASGSDGLCGPVKGNTDPADECPADDMNPCGADGSCDGMGACRAFAGKGTNCGATVCMSAALVAKQCDGSGVCGVITTDCSPFACDSGVCKATCLSTDDCAEGFACSDAGQCKPAVATCDGDHTTTGADGTHVDCTPFKCDNDGSCKSTCGTVDDCVSPNVCNGDSRKCEARPDSKNEPSGGCSCRTALPSHGSTGSAVALLLLVATARARRRATSRKTFPTQGPICTPSGFGENGDAPLGLPDGRRVRRQRDRDRRVNGARSDRDGDRRRPFELTAGEARRDLLFLRVRDRAGREL